MSTALDVDLGLLVGELPAEPCDTPGHALLVDVHDDGPATHYWNWHKPCGCAETVVVARCAAFTNLLLANGGMECGVCSKPGPTGLAQDFYTLIGPIGSL